MKKIVGKHVLLSMNNGHVLEGFVTNMEGEYLTLIECNNQEVLVRVEDISFARMGTVPEQPQSFRPRIEQPEQLPLPPQPQQEEYSMPLPTVQDQLPSKVRRPEFVRRTQR